VAILGATLLGERLTAQAVLGLAVASIGVFLVARKDAGRGDGTRGTR
jgi:drug/metabolite transporter (DMT)-like permease